jgi:thermostable 8-oxoguanine DNA glycosylase
MQILIDPKKITNFTRTQAELQSFFLFGLFCAGKNSDYAAKCLAKLLHNNEGETPFEVLKNLGETGIHNVLVASKIGQYGRLTKAIMDAVYLDLSTCTLEELMSVHGVGPKTARFFLVHTRPNCEYAVLDTHILKYMRDKGCTLAPENTPTNYKLYVELEKAFLYHAKIDFPFMSIADIDLTLWMKYSGRLENDAVEPKMFAE